jgi:hypothetical protein
MSIDVERLPEIFAGIIMFVFSFMMTSVVVITILTVLSSDSWVLHILSLLRVDALLAVVISFWNFRMPVTVQQFMWQGPFDKS